MLLNISAAAALPIMFFNSELLLRYDFKLVFIAFLLCQILIFFISQRTVKISFKKISRNVFNNGNAAYRKLLCTKNEFFDRRLPADVLHRFGAYISAVAQESNLSTKGFVYAAVTLCAIMFMLTLSAPLAGTIIVALIVNGVLTILQRQKLLEYIPMGEELSTRIDSQLLETFKGINAIKSAEAEKIFAATFSSRLTDKIDNDRSLAFTSEKFTKSIEICVNIEMMVMLILAYHYTTTGLLQLSTVFVLLFVRQLVITNATGLFNVFLTKAFIDTAYMRIKDLATFETEEQIALEKMPFKTLVVKNLLICHTKKRKAAVDIPKLSIAMGEKWTVSGVSGAGKTSLLRVLAGKDVEKICGASLELNGIKASFSDLRGMVYYHASDDIIFKGTIVQNIDMFSAKSDKDRVHQLIGLVGLKDRIEALPQGYMSIITNDIHPFSQGERQRLLLCRALYSQKPILLIDEPTSNLDPVSSELIVNALKNCDRTLLVATHDPLLIESLAKNLELNL